jgi:hypothetical protein
MMATFVRCIDERDNTFLLSISALADALRPLLQPAPADVATPDWATAPEWAQWWAVDSKGWAYWYAKEPYITEHKGWWTSAGQQEADTDKDVSAGCPAWRDTLTQRPQEQPRTFANPTRDDLQAALAGYQQEVAQTDARLLAADKRREIAERQLDDARQANAQLAVQVAAYRAQADAARQAATEAAQRADAAEAQNAEHRRKWEAIPWKAINVFAEPRIYQNSDAWELYRWMNGNAPEVID